MKVTRLAYFIVCFVGAEAGMRLLETTRVLGLVLVSACHTDLGVESEREAGYYSRPWLVSTT